MLGVGKGFLVRTQKIIITKNNNNKLKVIKIKILCSAEDIVKKYTDKPQTWEKYSHTLSIYRSRDTVRSGHSRWPFSRSLSTPYLTSACFTYPWATD